MQVRQRTQPSSTNSPNPFRGAIPFEAPRTAGGKAAPASRSPRDRILRHRASPEGATHLRARSTVGRDDSHKFEKDKYGNVQQSTTTYNKVSIVTLPARANALFRAIQPGSAANEPENAQRSGPHGDKPSEITAQGRKCQSDRTRHSKDVTKAVTARGLHLFPFRTEKLNPATPMVLRKWESR